MKILVTGGAGFIASHIADEYIKLGHKVVIIDDLSFGFRKNINKRAKFYKVNIKNRKLLEAVFRKEKFDIVNHHAARISVVDSVRHPEEVIAVNVLGTWNLLELSRIYGVKKFIFASTGGALYGSPDILPAKEDSEIRPESPYGVSKFLAEECVKFYKRMYDLSYLILRYANVYGPRQYEKGEAGVVAIFSKLMLKGKQPVIFGDGKKTRDYVFVKDVVRASILGLNKGKNEIINIGCGKEIKDYDVFAAVAKFSGFTGRPKFLPVRLGEVMKTSISFDKAKKILNWQPGIDFEQGIKESVKYYSGK